MLRQQFRVISDFKKFAKKRANELRLLATVDLTLHEDIAGQEMTLKVNVERQAAWKLYVGVQGSCEKCKLFAVGNCLDSQQAARHFEFGIFLKHNQAQDRRSEGLRRGSSLYLENANLGKDTVVQSLDFSQLPGNHPREDPEDGRRFRSTIQKRNRLEASG